MHEMLSVWDFIVELYVLFTTLFSPCSSSLDRLSHSKMPSVLSNTPFMSLRPDHSCGREDKEKAPATNGYKSVSRTETNGYTNGLTNGHTIPIKQEKTHEDDFLRLGAPQQDLLLLHGPRQKYTLAKAQDIPTLQDDREILIQVLAIGLNPVDWKGADYGFSQPSYPWINGRDFAGIVVRPPRQKYGSRIKQGDIVFGPSTDYRDLRKAAYQEYLVTTDYNVARLPQSAQVKQGAALGVAFVAASIALGVSLGVDFSRLTPATAEIDLLRLVRSLSPNDVPADIRDELFGGISDGERPQPGDWLAIWGGTYKPSFPSGGGIAEV